MDGAAKTLIRRKQDCCFSLFYIKTFVVFIGAFQGEIRKILSFTVEKTTTYYRFLVLCRYVKIVLSC